jgi:hypothetical protein
MTVFDMVAFVVLVSVIGGLIRTFIKSRAAGGGGLSAEQAARLVKLEERVKALEAVVGDASYELKQKFKELEKT